MRLHGAFKIYQLNEKKKNWNQNMDMTSIIHVYMQLIIVSSTFNIYQQNEDQKKN